MSTEETEDKRIFIGELSELLNRRPNTIRGWERSGRLPERLHSTRAVSGARSWRFWTAAQVASIVQWMKDEQIYPGSGLMNFKPTAEEIDAMITRSREPRKEPVEA